MSLLLLPTAPAETPGAAWPLAEPRDAFFRYRFDDATEDYATAVVYGGVRDSSGQGQPNAYPPSAGSRSSLFVGVNGHTYGTMDVDRFVAGGSLLTFAASKPGLTVAAVMTWTGAVGTARVIAQFSGATTSARLNVSVNSTGHWESSTRRLDTESYGVVTDPALAEAGRLYLIAAVHDFTAREQRLYVDGTLVATRTDGVSTGLSDPVPSVAFDWGASTVPNAYWMGDAYQITGWDRALTPTEATTLGLYAASRYGTPVPTVTRNVATAWSVWLPLAEETTDDFTAPDAAKWTYAPGVVVDGSLTITADATYPTATTNASNRFLDSHVSARLAAFPTPDDPSYEMLLGAVVAVDSSAQIGWNGSGAYVCRLTEVGTATETNPAYVSGEPIVRLRSSGTTIYWESSADATTWRVLRTATTGLDLTVTSIALSAGNTATLAAPGTAKWDDLNLVPAPPPAPTSTSALAGSSWSVRSTASRSTAAAWNITARVSVQRDTRWAVLAPLATSVSAATPTSWSVRAQTSGATSTAWGLRAQTPARVAPAAWSVRGSTTASRGTAWSVQSSVTATSGAAWTVRATVSDTAPTATVGTAWNVALPPTAPTIAAATVYESASATSVVIPVPPGTTQGSWLIATVTHSQIADIATITGWTPMGPVVSGQGTGSQSIRGFYRQAGASEPASYTWPTSATAGRVSGLMFRWTGTDPATLFDSTYQSASTATALSLTVPAVSTASDNSVVFTAATVNAATAADLIVPTGYADQTPTLAGTGRRTRAATRTQATAGSSGSLTWTQTSATTLQFAGFAMAVKGGPPTGLTSVSATRSTAWAVGDPVNPTGPLGPTGQWTRAFDDEFAGTVLDASKWRPNRSGGAAQDAPFNVGVEGAYFDPTQVTVAGGQLALTVDTTKSATIGGTTYPWASGTVSTEGFYTMPDGAYLEARIFVPAATGDGTGLWPAFWAVVSGRWPPEIDVFEYFNTAAADQARPYFNYHYDPGTGATQTGPSPYGVATQDYRGSWHTYGVLRSGGTATPYLDGIAYPGVAATGIVDTLPYFVILNLSVYASGTPRNGAQMLVDWVRVWTPGLTSQVTSTKPASWSVRTTLTATRPAAWSALALVTATRVAAWSARASVSATRPAAWSVRTSTTATRGVAWSVRAAATAATGSGIAWNVSASTTATTGSAWSVVSARPLATQTSVWSVAAQTTSTRPTTFAVRASVTGIASTTWVVRAQTTATRTASWSARAQTTATRAATWAVRATVAATRLTAWTVNTRLAITASTAWTVRAAVTATAAASWAVRAQTGTTVAAAYSIIGTTTAAVDAAWNVTSARPLATRPSAWAVAARLTATAPAAWTVRATAARTVSTAYNVQARTTGATPTAWTVRAQITDSQPTAYAVRAQTTRASASTWNVAAQLQAARPTSWNVLTAGGVSSGLPAAWNVRARANGSAGTAWTVRTSTTATATTTWAVRTSTTSTRPVSWAIAGPIVATASTAWAVRAQTTATRPTAFSVLARPLSTRAAAWSTAATISAARASSWTVLSRVSGTTGTAWTVRTTLTATRPTSWTVRTPVTGSWSSIWSVGGPVIATAPTAWTVRTPVTATQSATYAVWQSPGVRTAATTYRVRSLVAAARQTAWDVKVRASTARASTWAVWQPTTALRPAAWDVAALTGTTLPSAWNIRASNIQPVTVVGTGPRAPTMTGVLTGPALTGALTGPALVSTGPERA